MGRSLAAAAALVVAVVATAGAVGTKEARSATACSLYAAPAGLSTNTGLTPTSPWPLTKAVSNVVAGQTICLLSGTYAIASTISLSRSGTATAPIALRPYDGTPTLKWSAASSGTMLSVVADYIELQGLVFDGSNGAYLASSAVRCSGKHHHVALRYSTIQNTGGSGFSTSLCDYLTAERNFVYHVGYDPNVGWGSAITYNQSGGPYWADQQPGFHSYVVGNIIAGTTDESIHHSDGNGFINDRGNNVPPVLIANNLIYMNGGRCVNLYGTQHAWVVNNTCYKNALDLRLNSGLPEFNNLNSSDGTATDNHFVNNVAFAWTNRYPFKLASGSATYQYDVEWGGKPSAVPSSVKNDPSQLRRVDPLFTAPLAVDPTAGMQQATAPSPATITNQFVPGAGSPLIDAGMDPRLAAGMTDALRNGIDAYFGTDAAGNARLVGGGYDIGAYETVASPPPPPPPPPPNPLQPSVRGVATDTTNSASISATTSAAIGAGSLVLVVAHDGNAVPLSSVSGGGVTWSPPVNRTQGTVQAVAYAYGFAPPGGIPSGTAISGAFASANSRKTMQVIEVPGVDPTDPVDAANASAGSSLAAWSTGPTGSLEQPDEIVFGLLGTGAPNTSATSIAVAATPPFSLLSQVTTKASGSNRSQAVVYANTSSTASVTPSGTSNQTAGWAGLTVSFKAAPA